MSRGADRSTAGNPVAIAAAARRYQDAHALNGAYVSTSDAVLHVERCGVSFAETTSNDPIAEAVTVAVGKAPAGGWPNADAAVRAAALEYQKTQGAKTSLSDATKAVLAWMMSALSEDAAAKTDAPAFADAAALRLRSAVSRATPAALFQLVSSLRRQQARNV